MIWKNEGYKKKITENFFLPSISHNKSPCLYGTGPPKTLPVVDIITSNIKKNQILIEN